MIRSPEGLDKLDGIVQSVRGFATEHHRFGGFGAMTWRTAAEQMLEYRGSQPFRLQEVWEWLQEYYGLGRFLAYEIVTDLRHTALLDRAPDVMTWANPGPGALRGTDRLLGKNQIVRKGRSSKASPEEAHEAMVAILEASRSPKYWPQYYEPKDQFGVLETDGYEPELGTVWNGAWPRWEMREAEHTLCEWDKYERARLGQGRPRNNFP